MSGRSVMLGAPVASPPPVPPWPGATWGPSPEDTPAWSRPAQWSAGLLVALALGLLGYHVAVGHRAASRPTSLEPGALRNASLDLNRADHADLLQLPGVGDGLARRILEQRDRQGGFKSVEDLRSVRGVGPAILEQLRAFVHVVAYDAEEEVSPTASPGPKAASVPVAPPPPRPAAKRKGKKVPPVVPLDVNRASAAEFERHLEGIGPALSRRIVEARAQRPFGSVEELCRVKGIKAKTLERIRPHVAVREPPSR
jgi:competence protein ComEA